MESEQDRTIALTKAVSELGFDEPDMPPAEAAVQLQ